MRLGSKVVFHMTALGMALAGCDGLNLDDVLGPKAEELPAQALNASYTAECAADPTQRTCAGGGPNRGCDDGYVCGTSCECVPAEACPADAPVCSGDGPNAGCASDYTCSAQCVCEPGRVQVSARPSRSTTIDITADDAYLAMVNTDEGSVSFFSVAAGNETRISRVASSRRVELAEPMSVLFHPDQQRAFVANRAAGTVSRIVDVTSPYPSLDAEVELGGEPVGLALDPTGKKLWVTNWVSGQLHVIDTASMQVERSIPLGGNPWAITITNDGDQDGDDEKVLVTQFFGRPRAGVASEATDDGREGVVQIIDTYDPSKIREISLAPVEKCFVSPDLTSGCFPNQLLGITVHQAFGYTRAYVVSVAASPKGPVQFNHNMQALVSVIDVDSEKELTALTTNLNQGVAAQVDDDGDDTVGRRFLNTPNAIDFVNRDDAAIGYVSSAGSDIVLRVAFNRDDTVSVGSPSALNIPAGQNPTGLVVTNRLENAGAFVSNLISRDVSVLSFGDQNKVKDVASTDRPEPGTPEFDVWRGKRFFNTSTGIWSKEGWGSCQSCHPMGLTDNVTWQFATGPRQTIALDGQFASNDPTDMRALNWTAIFDETDDFENNTRGTSGGTGAIRSLAGPIVSAPAEAPPFSAVPMEDGVTTENHQNLSGSMKFLSRTLQVCTNPDTCPNWDQVDAYVQTIRTATAYVADPPAAQRGRLVFEDAGCNKCHAGAKWTVSRTFYTPEQFSGELGDRLFEANRALSTPADASPLQAIGLAAKVNVDATLLAGDDSDGGTPALLRQACNVRNVGTFGAEGGAAELRANQQPAQGRNGFNPPSLLGIATGAPYFHNGAAASLEAIFDGRFSAHLTAGNVNFYPTEGDRYDLAAFLLSIDEYTQPFDIIPESVICPLDFSQGGGDHDQDPGATPDDDGAAPGDGSYDDGSYEDGSYDDGATPEDGSYEGEQADDQSYDDGYESGEADDGSYDDGSYDDGYDDGYDDEPDDASDDEDSGDDYADY
jgi:YVTN family beta-propeller protein